MSLLQHYLANVATFLTVAFIVGMTTLLYRWNEQRKFLQRMQGIPAIGGMLPMPGHIHGHAHLDPAHLAAHEARMREALEQERDCRYLRFTRLSKLWPGEQDTGATPEQLQAEAALDRANDARDIHDLQRLDSEANKRRDPDETHT